jgi:hypothetical protein
MSFMEKEMLNSTLGSGKLHKRKGVRFYFAMITVKLRVFRASFFCGTLNMVMWTVKANSSRVPKQFCIFL